MPCVSIVLGTDRPGDCMTGLDVDHLIHTIQNGVKRQSFKSLELIVSDCLDRDFDWSRLGKTHFPIYHLPVCHNIPSIVSAYNNGLAAADGDYLVFLGDMCNFESGFIGRIVDNWEKTGFFTMPLRILERGIKTLEEDPRLELLGDKNTLVDDFIVYRYITCSRKAALKVEGFDERRPLMHFGEKLKAGGYHTLLDKNVVVKEQATNYRPEKPVKSLDYDFTRLVKNVKKYKSEFLVRT